MAAVLLKRLGQEGPAQLEVGQPLMQPQGAGQGVGQQGALVEVSRRVRPARHTHTQG